MAGILKVDEISEATQNDGVILNNNVKVRLADNSTQTVISTSGNTTTIDNVTLGSSAVPTNNYTFRNKIINGNFDFWQRGTSFTLASSLYTTDRWIVANDSATVTASQSSDVPNNNSKYSLTISSTNYTNGFYQIIEDLNRYLDGKTYTLSAYVKGPAGKTFHMSIGWLADGEQYTFTGDWQFISRTVTFPSNFSSTAGGSGNTYIHPIRWRTGDTISNLGVSDTIWITQVQFEEGPVATPFEHRPYGLELSLCKRYCQVIQMVGLFLWPYSSDRAWLDLPLMEPLRDYSSIQISKTRRVIRVTTYGVLDYWISGGNVYHTGDWLNDIYFGGFKPGYNNEVTNMGAYILKSGSGNFSDQEPVTISGVVNTSNDGFDSDGGFIIITSELT